MKTEEDSVERCVLRVVERRAVVECFTERCAVEGAERCAVHRVGFYYITLYLAV